MIMALMHILGAMGYNPTLNLQNGTLNFSTDNMTDDLLRRLATGLLRGDITQVILTHREFTQ